jgi:hypothetical protein
MAGRPLQSLRLRQAIVPHLRADPDLVAIGTPPISQDDRIYGRRQPATLVWPFVRVSVSDEAPLRRGSDIRVTVHSFSNAQFDDEIEQMNEAIQKNLENAVLELSPAYKAFLVWNGSQVMPDAAEADAWHGVNTFTATIG